LSNVVNINTGKKSLSQNEVRDFLSTNLNEFRRYAFSLTKDMNDADDLIQTVVERLLIKSIPTNVQPKAWFCRVCRNAWIDELRSRKVRQGPEDIEESQLEDQSVAMRPASQIKQIALENSIEKLAEPFKTVINLVVVAGLSYAEAAESLDVPIGTIMSRVARARKQLIDKLGHD